MNVHELFDELFLPLVLRNRSHNTIRLYRSTLKLLDSTLGRSAELSDLNDLTISRHLCQIAKTRAPATVAKERANILAIWRFACRKQIIEQWPDVEPQIVPLKVPRAWTEEEIRRLFVGLQKLDGSVGFIPARDWWTAIHWVAWDTGERIGAITGVLWNDVDLETRHIICNAENRKGKRADRCYKLSLECVESLKKIKRPREKKVFPWPFTKTYLWYRYKLILKKIGLEESGFHRLRKSVASHAAVAGLDPTELLGHANRRTTATYLDPRIVTPPSAADVLFRPA